MDWSHNHYVTCVLGQFSAEAKEAQPSEANGQRSGVRGFMVLMLEDYDGRNALAGYDLDIPHTRQAKSGRSDGAGVFKQYHQSVSAKAQTRSQKSEMPERGFGLRYSAFFRVSALGFRIWAAGGGWYCPVRLTGAKCEAFVVPEGSRR